VSKNRKIHAGLGGLLLLIGLGVFLARDSGGNRDSSRPDDPSAAGAASRNKDAAPARSGDRNRTAAQKHWALAKELPGTDDASKTTESPLFLSYLKSDPDRTTLRVGFRQEKREEVEQDDYTVEVNLLGSDGQNLGDENTTSSMWWTDEEDFANEGVPMLEVKSLNPVSTVELKLSYKGQAVELRKYEVAER
jgi:hypothetical protein